MVKAIKKKWMKNLLLVISISIATLGFILLLLWLILHFTWGTIVSKRELLNINNEQYVVTAYTWEGGLPTTIPSIDIYYQDNSKLIHKEKELIVMNWVDSVSLSFIDQHTIKILIFNDDIDIKAKLYIKKLTDSLIIDLSSNPKSIIYKDGY